MELFVAFMYDDWLILIIDLIIVIRYQETEYSSHRKHFILVDVLILY